MNLIFTKRDSSIMKIASAIFSANSGRSASSRPAETGRGNCCCPSH